MPFTDKTLTFDPKMKAKVGLRLSALFVAIHLLGHAFGHHGWDKPENEQMRSVVGTMKAYSADFMGANRSMADFYNGYSLAMFVWLGFTMGMLWIASGLIESNRKAIVKMVVPLGMAYGLLGGIELLYFFPFAAIISFCASASILWAAASRK